MHMNRWSLPGKIAFHIIAINWTETCTQERKTSELGGGGGATYGRYSLIFETDGISSSALDNITELEEQIVISNFYRANDLCTKAPTNDAPKQSGLTEPGSEFQIRGSATEKVR